MKFKAVTNAEAPHALISAFNRLRDRLEREIGAECFLIPVGSMGPAELYVQKTDLAERQKPFVNYNASGITLKPERDFNKALEILKGIVFEILTEHWPNAGSVQVMIVIHASTVDGTKSQLFEFVDTVIKPGIATS